MASTISAGSEGKHVNNIWAEYFTKNSSDSVKDTAKTYCDISATHKDCSSTKIEIEDLELYDFFPFEENLLLVKCSKCGRVTKVQYLESHEVLCTRNSHLNSENVSNKAKNSKKRRNDEASVSNLDGDSVNHNSPKLSSTSGPGPGTGKKKNKIYDSTLHCGVMTDGKHCTRSVIHCRHKIFEKREVPRNVPLEELYKAGKARKNKSIVQNSEVCVNRSDSQEQRTLGTEIPTTPCDNKFNCNYQEKFWVNAKSDACDTRLSINPPNNFRSSPQPKTASEFKHRTKGEMKCYPPCNDTEKLNLLCQSDSRTQIVPKPVPQAAQSFLFSGNKRLPEEESCGGNSQEDNSDKKNSNHFLGDEKESSNSQNSGSHSSSSEDSFSNSDSEESSSYDQSYVQRPMQNMVYVQQSMMFNSFTSPSSYDLYFNDHVGVPRRDLMKVLTEEKEQLPKEQYNGGLHEILSRPIPTCIPNEQLECIPNEQLLNLDCIKKSDSNEIKTDKNDYEFRTYKNSFRNIDTEEQNFKVPYHKSDILNVRKETCYNTSIMNGFQ